MRRTDWPHREPLDDVEIEWNETGFYLHLSDTLSTSAAILMQTQARCREKLLDLHIQPRTPYTLLHVDPPAATGTAEHEMYDGAYFCPQSPLALPSRKRPVPAYDEQATAEPAAGCPQSPLALPSRKRPVPSWDDDWRPFGRDESGESLDQQG